MDKFCVSWVQSADKGGDGWSTEQNVVIDYGLLNYYDCDIFAFCELTYKGGDLSGRADERNEVSGTAVLKK